MARECNAAGNLNSVLPAIFGAPGTNAARANFIGIGSDIDIATVEGDRLELDDTCRSGIEY
jgi:hypothetical protein